MHYCLFVRNLFNRLCSSGRPSLKVRTLNFTYSKAPKELFRQKNVWLWQLLQIIALVNLNNFVAFILNLERRLSQAIIILCSITTKETLYDNRE